jgi:hypothetical protein
MNLELRDRWKALMGEKRGFLPEDVYTFFGHQVYIQSNSQEVLEQLKFMYTRFYSGPYKIILDPTEKFQKASRATVQIIDNLASSNELIINDHFYLYRLSKTDDHYQFTCQDLHNPAQEFVEVCDPLSLIQSAIIRTVSFLEKGYYHLFHAGVVSWDGEGIILPASSFMGKTTLVLKLVSNGFKFLSDEVACLDPVGGILEPFPRKLNVRHGSPDLLGLSLELANINDSKKINEWGWRLDIEDIVPSSISASCPIRYILFLRGFGDKPSLECISASDALFELFKFSVSPINDCASILFKFASLINGIQCFNLVAGDLDETFHLIMGLVAGKTPGY